jgi:hypothetical protein
MMWFAFGFLILAAGVTYGAFRVDTGPGSADERASSGLLYIAGAALWALSFIFWVIAVTVHTLQ